MEGVHVVGVWDQGVWGTDLSPPVGSRGTAPVGGLGDEERKSCVISIEF